MKKVLLIALIVVMAVFAFAGCSPASGNTAAEEDATTPAEEPVAAEDPATEDASEEPAAETADAASEETAADDSWQKIQDKGSFIMGLDDKFPPMGFRDEAGELVGFDIDLARLIAEQMGVEVQLQPIDWTAKEMELDSGNIDVIWNGYTITDERKEKVLMSDPYMKNEQVMLVLADSDITTLEDLAGQKIAVQEGSSAQSMLEKSMPELLETFDELVGFKDYTTALLDVDSGQVAALAVDLVVADYYMAQKEGSYVLLDERLDKEEYGIGFRKGDQSFHDALMAAFEELKANGAAAELSNEWFGRDVTADF
ncbi:transporter substrate-binding domain-containing protein [Christensenellaceae bacterium OttesenSCG-928-K19]|nr:transporter substrate-binding domain-containing protein [Christensenellaceae bacterium OttesenSCG-928-K19]